MRRLIVVFAAAALMVIMVMLTVAPGLAQTQSGLVNVVIGDVTVVVPVGVAANICGVNANVIAEQNLGTQNPVCTADADAMALVPSPFQP